ncbi:MAG: hypothetical protein AB4290_29995 [Spirulina sp.]
MNTTNFCVSSNDRPCFLMNAPFFVSADVINNQIMMDVLSALSPDEQKIDIDRALSQFHELYSFISRYALVYLLPSYPGLQDQTYVANLGIVLPHLVELILIPLSVNSNLVP